ncbi:hypothetical protein IWW37_004007 [Coemansia sp. RSA 2050]|nr:hypothetical protein IWW37_004007 [Coemansia sp. RSA 2050]KAJ2732452.1 hypothetical protein IW152_003783 [Coemansia sp. BCRC 34962]
MNSSEPNPPKSLTSNGANRNGQQGPHRPGRGRRSQPADRVTSEGGQKNQPDDDTPSNGSGGRRRNGPPSRGAAAGGSRGKKKQPSCASSGPLTANTAPVMPRILMRPERIAQVSEEAAPTVILARRPVSSPPPPQHLPLVRPLAQVPVPAESLTIADVPAYKNIADQPRGNRLMLLSPAGKLLDSVVRKHLGPLDCRLCIGVLGRPSTGKSLVLSRLAQYHAGADDSLDVFPLAAENKIGTLGVDFWVTPARIILIDAPPVLSLVPADVRLRLAGPGAPGLATARTRDLQLATLLMQVCDVLMVFANSATGMDEGLVRLLVDARTLSQDLPRLDAPHLVSEPSDGQRHRCKLYIVLNNGGDIDGVARRYEEATGITVSGASIIPSRAPAKSLQPAGVPRFLQVAEAWKELPLYPPPLDVSKAAVAKTAGSEKRRSLLGYPLAGGSCGSFELAIDELRARLMAPVSPLGWDERAQGVWMNTCLRAWDSIRRSFQLQNLALAFEQENGGVGPAVLSRSGRSK